MRKTLFPKSLFILLLTFFSFNLTLSAQESVEGEYIRKAFLSHLKKPFNLNGKKKVLIIGDSHAQDFFNGVLENNYLSEYQVSTRYIPNRCQVYLSDNLARYLNSTDKELCKKSDNLLKAKTQIKQADVVILAASWKKWTATALPQTIKRLGLSSKQQLFVIGGKSFGKITPERYNTLSKKERLNLRNQVSVNQPAIYEILMDNLDPSIFINLHQLICGSSNTCPVFTDELKLISLDGGHLTKSGAKYIGRILFQLSSLKHL